MVEVSLPSSVAAIDLTDFFEGSPVSDACDCLRSVLVEESLLEASDVTLPVDSDAVSVSGLTSGIVLS